MDTETHRTIRQNLEDHLQDVLRRHDVVEAHLRRTDRALPDDWQERGAALMNDEVLEGLEEQTRVEIIQLTSALARIQEGSYGECVSCDEPIGERRLLALPTATLCIACASAREQPS